MTLSPQAADASERARLSSQELPSETPQYFTPLHRQILALHVNGQNYSTIARSLGIAPATVSRVIRSQKAQTLISEIASFHRLELAALTAPALDAVRRNLQSPQGAVSMKAAELVLGSQGMLGQAAQNPESAEGAIARALALVAESGTELRLVQQTAVELKPPAAERGEVGSTRGEVGIPAAPVVPNGNPTAEMTAQPLVEAQETHMSSGNDYGQVAYNKYREVQGGKAFHGGPIPEWHEVREDIKTAWRRAVDEA